MPRGFVAPICLLGLALSAAGGLLAEQRKADATVSQTLKLVEETWAKAEKNHDAATFEKLVADDWIAITPHGKTQTKAERAAKIKSSKVGSATLGNMRVRVFGDTAVVTGSADETTTQDGKETSGHYAWTDVFVKRGGKWLCVASQTAAIK